MSRSRYESLRRDGALGKGGAYCVYWFQSRVPIVEERSYLQVPSVTGHVTMTSTMIELKFSYINMEPSA